MTIDQRLEFLLQSTESLHANTQSLYATSSLHSSQIDAVIRAMDKMEHKFAEMAATMSDLAVVVLNHERRLGKLDGLPDQT